MHKVGHFIFLPCLHDGCSEHSLPLSQKSCFLCLEREKTWEKHFFLLVTKNTCERVSKHVRAKDIRATLMSIIKLLLWIITWTEATSNLFGFPAKTSTSITFSMRLWGGELTWKMPMLQTHSQKTLHVERWPWYILSWCVNSRKAGSVAQQVKHVAAVDTDTITHWYTLIHIVANRGGFPWISDCRRVLWNGGGPVGPFPALKNSTVTNSLHYKCVCHAQRSPNWNRSFLKWFTKLISEWFICASWHQLYSQLINLMNNFLPVSEIFWITVGKFLPSRCFSVCFAPSDMCLLEISWAEGSQKRPTCHWNAGENLEACLAILAKSGCVSLIHWIINWFIHWFIDWLIHWLIH